MTVEQLQSIGLTDEALVREYRRVFSRPIVIPSGNGGDATAVRRDVFNALCASWYA